MDGKWSRWLSRMAASFWPEGCPGADLLLLNPDGSVNDNFHAGPMFHPRLPMTIGVQSDGKIVAGGFRLFFDKLSFV
jgi:hypothetical protein